VAQCKEKFGGLRFYLDAGSTISDQMWQLVRDAEQDSYNICEFCGASPASISKDRWWLKSLCTTCDSQSRVETPEQYQRDPQSVPDEFVQH
jgi:murein tripeptide amidase MpaA